MTKPSRNKRLRKRATDSQRRAAIAPYLAELERGKVPPLVIAEAAKVIALLLKAAR
jgi:hypothetical protein